MRFPRPADIPLRAGRKPDLYGRWTAIILNLIIPISKETEPDDIEESVREEEV